MAIATRHVAGDPRDPLPPAAARLCTWCKRPITSRRRDATTCSKSCRQAKYRFRRAVGVAQELRDVSPADPRRIAYADPPYPGMSRRYYGDHPDYAGEVDHEQLIASLSAASEHLGPVDVRPIPARRPRALPCRGQSCCLDPWPAAACELLAFPLNAWEPVLYFNPRPVAPPSSDASPVDGRRTDVLLAGVTARTTDPAADP